MIRTLRGRLIAALILGLTLLLAANGFAIHRYQRRRLVAALDRSLLQFAVARAPELVRPRGPRFAPEDPPAPLEGRAVTLFEVRSTGGARVRAAAELGEAELPRLAEGLDPVWPPRVTPRDARFAWITLPGGARCRAVGLVLDPPAPERRPAAARRPPPLARDPAPVEVVVARDASELFASLEELARLLALAWASSTVGSALLVGWLVQRGLRPLDRLRRELAARDVATLGKRIELPDAPAELEPVVRQLDALLARLEDAFERERTFTADVAHELRTPLAGLRSTLELQLSRPRTPEAWQEAGRTCLAVTGELEAIVEALLSLRRAEAGAPVAERERLDLAELVRDVVRAHEERGAERGITFDLRLAERLEIESVPTLLARVIANLVGNATEHAPEGECVEVRLVSGPGGFDLRVRNAAPDAPPDVARRALETFWRGDPARGAEGGHLGLGLPLAARIAASLGLELALEHDGRAFTASLRPLRPPRNGGEAGTIGGRAPAARPARSP